jgi:hypothetical protein
MTNKENLIVWCPTCVHFRRSRRYEDSLRFSDSLIDDELIPCDIVESTREFWKSYFATPKEKRTLYPKDCPKWSLSPRPNKLYPPAGQIIGGVFILIGVLAIFVLLIKGLDWLERNTILPAAGRVLRVLFFLISSVVVLIGALIAWIKKRR